MKAVMLAAGIGARLGSNITEPPPKVLLRFGGKSLLEYHLKILKEQGIDELVLGVGYKHDDIEQEIAALSAQDFVRTVFNADYREGNIITLWSLRDDLSCGDPVLLMDADLLYDEELLKRLINSPRANCLLLDRGFEPGDEPVKICVRDGQIVEFRKWLSADFSYCGESVGMFKLSSDAAARIIAQTKLYLDQGHRQAPYEETIRDVLLTSPRGTFAFEDITGLPWIEIDFAVDVTRAEDEILPQIVSAVAKRRLLAKGKTSFVRDGARDL
ncbi:MAG: phosphocholine cytidylyltransferase family protein [Alphaproteobacteria bacterium]|nr:phosphocholine cytidylyltransferase family protein [Alphaproteobacteria bacterium]